MFGGRSFTAVIDKSSYEIPNIFKRIMEKGVEEDHMYNTFNMGIGFVIAVSKEDAQKTMKKLKSLGEEPVLLGHVISGGEGVCLK